MQYIESANIQPGTKVLVRGDLDVPIKDGKVLETYRLDSLIPTINYILYHGGIPIIMGHIGKPDGTVKEELSTKHLEAYFKDKLDGSEFEVLENLRFDKREELNDPSFAKELAAKADIYVNDSFATSHRKHASIVGVPQLLPSYAGLELKNEVENLDKVLTEPTKPLVVIIGGAKLESKKPVISKFLSVADYILIGGKIGMEWKEPVQENLLLPCDYAKDSKDIGPKTIEQYRKIIQQAGTILWAGPLGAYEEDEFIMGTKAIAIEVAVATSGKKAFSVIGGGDTIAALQKLELLDNYSFVSTGGGAMLEYLSEGTLPGIEALK